MKQMSAGKKRTKSTELQGIQMRARTDGDPASKRRT